MSYRGHREHREQHKEGRISLNEPILPQRSVEVSVFSVTSVASLLRLLHCTARCSREYVRFNCNAASGPDLSVLTDFAGDSRLKIAEIAGFYLTQEAKGRWPPTPARTLGTLVSSSASATASARFPKRRSPSS